jgi:GNAT superfamily N-acetyltransferase
MDIIQQNLYIRMERGNLTGVADCPLPPEFSVRWYRPGDERKWVSIHKSAEQHVEVCDEVFQRVFDNDVAALRERQCFLLDAHNDPIATATAWFDGDYFGYAYGRVHWVAVVPEYQGRGLSKCLISIILARMIALGHDRAYLRTSTSRLPAITLYQAFGFAPSLRTPEDCAIWKQLNPLLPRPFPWEGRVLLGHTPWPAGNTIALRGETGGKRLAAHPVSDTHFSNGRQPDYS